MTLLTPLMRGTALTAEFSDLQLLQGMLDFEAALARAQADCGVIPATAVRPIVRACRAELFDQHALAEAARAAGNLAIPLIKHLTARVKDADPDAARYVHWGATSQDVIDTGLVLQLRAALNHTQHALGQLTDTFARQALRYQHTVMPGRTWMQQALPVTWGENWRARLMRCYAGRNACNSCSRASRFCSLAVRRERWRHLGRMLYRCPRDSHRNWR